MPSFHHLFRRHPSPISSPSPFAGTSTPCPYAFCTTGMAGPGPAMNVVQPASNTSAASAVTDPDPSQRDPNAALNSYNHRMGLETTLGIVFAVAVVVVALGLWVALDKHARRFLRRNVFVCGKRAQARREREKEEDRTREGFAVRPQLYSARASMITVVGSRGDVRSMMSEKVVAPVAPGPGILQRQSTSSEGRKPVSAPVPRKSMPSEERPNNTSTTTVDTTATAATTVATTPTIAADPPVLPNVPALSPMN